MAHGRLVQDRFTFSDLGRVHWATTVKLALARGFCAGLVWAAIVSTGPMAPQGAQLLLMPFAWAMVAVPLGLFLQVGMLIPLVGGWLSICGALFVCIGDPLVYTVNRSLPAALNIADLRLFNFQPMIFVLLPD